MFEGEFEDTYAKQIPLVLMGGQQSVPSTQTQKQGPPSAEMKKTIKV
jgi:hypothetical protein